MAYSAAQKYLPYAQNMHNSDSLASSMQLFGTHSGGGYGGSSSGSCFSVDICPDLLLAGIAAAAAAGVFVIYAAITMAAERKKRSSKSGSNSFQSVLANIINLGKIFSFDYEFNDTFAQPEKVTKDRKAYYVVKSVMKIKLKWMWGVDTSFGADVFAE